MYYWDFNSMVFPSYEGIALLYHYCEKDYQCRPFFYINVKQANSCIFKSRSQAYIKKKKHNPLFLRVSSALLFSGH